MRIQNDFHFVVTHVNLKLCRHVQQASSEWLQAKHATNELLGKVELLFRPFLRWLDRNLERLFTEGARKVKMKPLICLILKIKTISLFSS